MTTTFSKLKKGEEFEFTLYGITKRYVKVNKNAARCSQLDWQFFEFKPYYVVERLTN